MPYVKRKTKEEIMAILPTPAFVLRDTVEINCTGLSIGDGDDKNADGVKGRYKGFFVYCEYDWNGVNKIRKVGIISIKHPNGITEIARDNMTIATTRLVLTEKKRKVLTNEK